MLFFQFLHLTVCSRNSAIVHTTYAIYFLIHHCTNSLSPLHIFVHHFTFCASLHTKTSPVVFMLRKCPVFREEHHGLDCSRDVNKDLTPKDLDKDKDLTPKDQVKDK